MSWPILKEWQRSKSIQPIVRYLKNARWFRLVLIEVNSKSGGVE